MKTLACLLALLVLSPLASAQTAEPFRSYIVGWEGYSHKPYLRANGERSVGIGHNTKGDRWREYYSDRDIERCYQRDYARALDACRADVRGFDRLPYNARVVCLSLCWTVGRHGFHRFRVFRTALSQREYGIAARSLSHSLWASQVSPARLADHLQRLRSLTPIDER